LHGRVQRVLNILIPDHTGKNKGEEEENDVCRWRRFGLESLRATEDEKRRSVVCGLAEREKRLSIKYRKVPDGTDRVVES
jgi:hypothetical protein